MRLRSSPPSNTHFARRGSSRPPQQHTFCSWGVKPPPQARRHARAWAPPPRSDVRAAQSTLGGVHVCWRLLQLATYEDPRTPTYNLRSFLCSNLQLIIPPDSSNLQLTTYVVSPPNSNLQLTLLSELQLTTSNLRVIPQTIVVPKHLKHLKHLYALTAQRDINPWLDSHTYSDVDRRCCFQL